MVSKFWYFLNLIFLVSFGALGQAQAQVSITSHGAVASSGVDNLAAINRAIADARSKGVAVSIPAGTFGYRGVIHLDSVKLIGQGSTSVLHSLDPDNLAIFAYGSGVEVRNLKLAGVYGPRFPNWEGTRITLMGASNFVIDSVTIEGSTGAGIQTAPGTHHGRITNNIIRNTQADSIHMTDGANFITLENNLIENAGDDGIAVVSYQENPSAVHDITARNNRVLNNRHGRNMTVVGGRNVLYENNYMEGNPHAACLYLSQEASYHTYGVINVTAQYNTMKNCGSTETGHSAVMIFTEDEAYLDGIRLIRNDIYQPSHLGGVRVFGSLVRNVRLESNRISGVQYDYSIESPNVTLIRYSSGAVGYTSPSAPTPAPAPTPTPSPSPSCSYPNWVQGQQYAAGAIVTYNGSLYRAKYANPGYNPTISTYYWASYSCSSSPTPAPSPSPSCSFPAWVQGRHYEAGAIVSYNGSFYRAKYANPGYNPTVSTYYWASYSCSSSPTPAPTPAPSCSYPAWVQGQQYAAGAIVTYSGKLYRAKYANPGYNPTISTYYWASYSCP